MAFLFLEISLNFFGIKIRIKVVRVVLKIKSFGIEYIISVASRFPGHQMKQLENRSVGLWILFIYLFSVNYIKINYKLYIIFRNLTIFSDFKWLEASRQLYSTNDKA